MKICHIRGDEEYWKQTLKRPKKQFDVSQCIYYMETLFNIDYFYYRKKQREVTIKSIEESNHFDHICYNDKEFADLYKRLKDNEHILYFGIDDDDLYVGGDIITSKLENGYYICKNVTFATDTLNIHQLQKQNSWDIRGQYLPYTIHLQDLKSPKFPSSCSQFIVCKLKTIKPLFKGIDTFVTHAASAGRSKHPSFRQLSGILKGSPNKSTYNKTKKPIKISGGTYDGVSVFNSNNNTVCQETLGVYLHQYTSSTVMYNILKSMPISFLSNDREGIENYLRVALIEKCQIFTKINIENLPYWSEVQTVAKEFMKNIKN